MTRRLRIGLGILGALSLLVVALGVGVLALVFSASGTQWALSELRSRLQDAGVVLDWDSLEGTLGSGLRIGNFSMLSVRPGNRIDLDIAELEFAWQPWNLLGYAIALDSVRIVGLRYESDSVQEDTGPLSVAELQNSLFGLPLSFDLQHLEVGDVQVRLNDASFGFDVLVGSALLDSEHLELNVGDFRRDTLAIAGEAVMQRDLGVEGGLEWRVQAGGRDFNGALELGGSLGQLQLRHTLAAPLRLDSGGTLDPGVVTVGTRFDLRHTAPEIALAQFGVDTVAIRDLDVRTSGSPDSIAIRGGLDAAVEGFEPLDLALALQWQPGMLGIDRLRLVSPQVDLEASGALELEPLALALQWTLSRLESGASLPVELSGLAGSGSVQLTESDGVQQLTLVVSELEGLLNQYPLTLAGQLGLVDSQLASVNLQASNQDNVLSLTGSAAPALDLRWQLNAPALQQLWDGLDGALEGQGTITGTQDAPAVNGTLGGSGLEYASAGTTLTLASVTLDAAYGEAANAITLELGALALRDETGRREVLREGSIELGGTPAEHRLTADLALAQGDAQLALAGAAADGNWQGRLERAALVSEYGDWQLENPAAITYIDGALAVAETCLGYSAMRFCVEGEKPATGGIDLDASLDELPLAWLNRANGAPSAKPVGLQRLQDEQGFNLPQNLRVSGFLDAEFALRNFAAGAWESLDLRLQPRDLVLTVDMVPLEEEGEAAATSQRFRFDADELHVGGAGGNWNAQAALDIALEAQAGFRDQGDLRANMTLGAGGELDGTLAFAFSDIAWVESFAPAMVRMPRGALDGNATIGGSREMPVIDAELELRGGGFVVPEYGLDISEIDASLRSTGSEDFTLNLSARSGTGAIVLRADIQDLMQEGRRISAQLDGDGFQAIDTEYASAAISPALRAELAGGELRIDGRVDVPRMTLDLEELVGDIGGSGVNVSRDVVVVSTTDTSAETPTGERVVVPLYANLALALGDEVTLRGFGLDASLTGELTLEQAPNRPALVYGELNIPAGSYEIYNQRLNTEDGRVMFFGNPTNPVVDIRAFRETATAEVGMQLSGSINDIQGQLYSTPTLPESEILALLVTGKSFNNVNDQDSDALLGAIASFGFERGQGLTSAVGSKLGLDSVAVVEGDTFRESALGLGKYITPNLLMQYKVGLFDRQSVLSIDYSLTERLKLEVETGLSQSIEISYTIEKD